MERLAPFSHRSLQTKNENATLRSLGIGSISLSVLCLALTVVGITNPGACDYYLQHLWPFSLMDEFEIRNASFIFSLFVQGMFFAILGFACVGDDILIGIKRLRFKNSKTKL